MTIKNPQSLRQKSVAPIAASSGLGLFAACVIGTTSAIAQTETTLPVMNVEAPAIAKPKPKPRRGTTNTTTRNNTAQATEASAQDVAPSQGESARKPNANPNADARAPYKVNQSGSSKLTEPLLNTPRSVTAIPKEVMEDKGATSVRELVRTTPGLTLGTGEGGNAFGDRVFIRGFDARNDMYINGIRESGVSTRETFMTEQVEVLMGPAGSIGGRGTTGGAINVVTKQPTSQDFQNMTVTGGTDLTRRIAVDVNQNINPDLAIRANGLFHESNVAGRDNVFDNRYGGSLAAQWKPREDFKANFDYYHVKFDQMPDWGVPFDPRTRRPFTESGLDRSNFYGLGDRDFQRNFQHLATAGFEWKLSPDVTVTNKTRYGFTVTDYVASKPGTPSLTNTDPSLWTVSATPASLYQVARTVANISEATLKFDTSSLKHTLVTGVEVQGENFSRDTYTGLTVECNPSCTTGISTNLWDPTNFRASVVGSPTKNGQPTKTDVNTLAVYALDTVNWNDKILVNIGTRIDRYAITRQPYNSTQASRDDVLLNGNIGLTYKLLPSASLYAAFGTSSNPVGAEMDGNSADYGAITTGNQTLRPERNTSAEAGTKWELFDRRALLTAALFQTTKDHARETIGSGASAVIQDTAAYRIRGLEFTASGKLTDEWSLFGGMSFLNSQVEDSATASNIGRPLANIAHASFNLLTKYQLTKDLSIGTQATYKGEILGGTTAATWYSASTVNVSGSSVATPAGYNKLPSGWRFDLMAEYQISKVISAKFIATNIFDKVLYDAFYRSNTPFVYLSPGRSAQLTLQAKF